MARTAYGRPSHRHSEKINEFYLAFGRDVKRASFQWKSANQALVSFLIQNLIHPTRGTRIVMVLRV